MRIGVFGVDAASGHLAARLGVAGHDVACVARGADPGGVRARGVTSRREGETVTSRVRASERPADLGGQDVIIVAVEAAFLPDVADAIGPPLGPETAVVFAQDGAPWCHPVGLRPDRPPPPDLGWPDRGDRLRRSVGERRTIGGVARASDAAVEPGGVAKGSPRGDPLCVGEIDDAQSARGARSKATIEGAGLDSPATPDLRQALWRKLVQNMAESVLCASTGRTAQAAAEDPVLSLILRGVIAEASAVADAYGASSTEAGPARGGAPDHEPRFLRALEPGRPMEADAAIETLLAIARASNVETPILERLSAIAVRRATDAGHHRETL